MHAAQIGLVGRPKCDLKYRLLPLPGLKRYADLHNYMCAVSQSFVGRIVIRRNESVH